MSSNKDRMIPSHRTRAVLRTKATEETILFLSVAKWTLLATATGLLVGLPTAVFLKLLGWGWHMAREVPFYFLCLPLALAFSSYIVRRLAPEAEGHGTDKVIEAVHERAGRIPLAVVPIKLLATVVTITAGGSVGKEGPCAQIGAGLASTFADLLRFSDRDRKKLVVCGIGAGFSAVFGTPIAGAIFGVEVLQVGAVAYDMLLPSIIAGVTSYHVAAAMGVHYFNAPLAPLPAFSEGFLMVVALSGVFFGLCALLLIEVLAAGRWLSRKLPWSPTGKALAAGALVALGGLWLGPGFLGTGTGPIEAALKGVPSQWFAVPAKIGLTTLTLAFGGSGGVVTPIFFVGSAAGSVFGSAFGVNLALFAAIGMVSVLAGAANTPIAAAIMAMELFGADFAAFASIACAVSFLMAGHRTVYPAQILGFAKSGSLVARPGRALEP